MSSGHQLAVTIRTRGSTWKCVEAEEAGRFAGTATCQFRKRCCCARQIEQCRHLHRTARCWSRRRDTAAPRGVGGHGGAGGGAGTDDEDDLDVAAMSSWRRYSWEAGLGNICLRRLTQGYWVMQGWGTDANQPLVGPLSLSDILPTAS